MLSVIILLFILSDTIGKAKITLYNTQNIFPIIIWDKVIIFHCIADYNDTIAFLLNLVREALDFD
jgi:hypothetical protein